MPRLKRDVAADLPETVEPVGYCELSAAKFAETLTWEEIQRLLAP
jgi:hypothetical protein